MPRIAALAFSIFAVCATGAAAGPLYGLFEYHKPQPPLAGDCAEIAAAIGPHDIWYGEFSGKRYDDFTDNYQPFAARGCFESEFACRAWQNDAISYLGRGPIYYMTCRRGR